MRDKEYQGKLHNIQITFHFAFLKNQLKSVYFDYFCNLVLFIISEIGILKLISIDWIIWVMGSNASQTNNKCKLQLCHHYRIANFEMQVIIIILTIDKIYLLYIQVVNNFPCMFYLLNI